MKRLIKLNLLRLLAVGVFVVFLGLMVVYATSHREAPLIRFFGAYDNTDVYAFVSPDDPSTITIIANFYPFQDPNGGPNFYGWPENVEYQILIDNDGDAKAEVKIEFEFETEIRDDENTFLYATGPIMSLDDPNWNVRQFYDFKFKNKKTGLKFKVRDLAVPPDNIGPASTPSYEALAAAAIHDLGNGFKVFAGQRDDPFFFDFGAGFDLLTIRPGAPGNMGGGVDQGAGLNINAIVVQGPISAFTKDGSTPTDPSDEAAVLGIWSIVEVEDVKNIFKNAVSEKSKADDFFDESASKSSNNKQISRLANCLFNELLFPLGEKDNYNSSEPKDDVDDFLQFVEDPEPARLFNAIFGLSVPPTPRADFVQLFLTGIPGLNQPPDVEPGEMMRLNVAIPPIRPGEPGFSPFGVIGGDLSGYPNGRRLEDDAIDITFRVAAGVLVPGFNIFPNNVLGDGVDVNDVPFLSSFPYAATPHQGFEHTHHRLEPPHPALSSGREELTAISEADNQSMPTVFQLEQSYPNPFNPTTNIRYQLPEAVDVKIRVYNVRGELIRTLVDGNVPAGYHTIQWDSANDHGTRVASGLYFYRIETPEYVKSRHMILLK